MPRRAHDLRRSGRTRLRRWIWWLVAVCAVGGLLLQILRHLHKGQLHQLPIREKHTGEESPAGNTVSDGTQLSRQLSEQMTLAKAYAVVAKERGDLRLAWELSWQIRACQRLLSQSAVRDERISEAEADPVISHLANLIFRAQGAHYDIGTALVTLKNNALTLEEHARAVVAESTEFGRLAAESLPKSLHCLAVRLTEEWFSNPALQRLAMDHRSTKRLHYNNLFHFCLFSDNVLAAHVAVNSTVSACASPEQLVFHLVTDPVNFRAMSAWFISNDFRGSMVDVRSIDEFPWLLGHLSDARFHVARIHPQLEKVVLLEDDVVVQKDLMPLFSVELHGNVVGATETCLEAFHRYYKYLNFSDPVIVAKVDPQACGWALGVNVLDLTAWRKADVTAAYRYWRDRNEAANGTLWKKGTVLPAALLTFYGLVEPLDRRWQAAGLGYDADVDERILKTAAVVHFGGNMKPWTRLRIARYSTTWERHVDPTHRLIRECQVVGFREDTT